MSKKSRLSTKPGTKNLPVDSDSWVQDREESKPVSKGKVKRITFEVSEEDHKKTKIIATKRGLSIKELMQTLLNNELKNN